MVISFKKKKPSLAKYWDAEKNNLSPSDVSYGSNQKYWFKCQNKHSFQEAPKILVNRNIFCKKCDFELKRLDKTYPKISKEWDNTKNKTRPIDHTYGQHTKIWWICKKGHSWEVAIKERTIGNYGCPYCSHKKLSVEFSLKHREPEISNEWDYKKNMDRPENVFASSHQKRWWICSNGHSYQARLSHRVSQRSGCNYCGSKLVSDTNNLAYVFPDTAKQWNYKKNKDRPEDVFANSHQKRWWICEKGHSWQQSIAFRRERGCPYCANVLVSSDNNLKKVNPKLSKEWDYEKNIKRPEDFVFGSRSRVYWKCKKNHSWKASIDTRNRGNTGCPYCANRKLSDRNNLAYVFPDTAKQWNYKKNKDRPEDVIATSHSVRWWVCEFGHEWKVQVKTRKTNGCPYCRGTYVSDTNNLAYVFPDIAKEWDYKKNKDTPKDVTSNSGKKRWWVCVNGHNWYSPISNRTPSIEGKQTGSGCPYCTLTPRSKDEIYLLFELKNFYKIAEDDHKIKLSRVNDVDIKLSNEKVVIEYDGAYWHKDKAERDKRKTKELQKAGWTVIRVREKPLKILSRKYNVPSISQDYKNNANKVLQKLDALGFNTNNLDKYLERKTLINKKEADIYISNILKKKST